MKVVSGRGTVCLMPFACSTIIFIIYLCMVCSKICKMSSTKVRTQLFIRRTVLSTYISMLGFSIVSYLDGLEADWPFHPEVATVG